MSRSTLGVATLAQLSATTARPVLFMDLHLDAGIERFHTWIGEIVWDSNTWYGAGELASVEEVEETVALSAAPLRVGLNGVDSTILDLVDDEDIYLRAVNLYLGCLNESEVLVENPGLIFAGFVQNVDLVMGGPEGDSVSLTIESELLELNRTRNVRYTDAQLQTEYPGDVGLEYLEQTKDFRTLWRGHTQTRLGAAVHVGNGTRTLY